MTDIVEQGRLYIRAEAPDYYEKTVVWKMADEIEQLREENQELKLQYLSDQGQWIEETGRLRAALRKWDKVVSEYGDAESAWQNGELDDEAYHASYNAVMEHLYEARTALGEKETV